MGDMEGLKAFFRQRIDELTMKPVRAMLTAWIKQMEPRRMGGYGKYHRRLPSERPAHTTPPWWPQNVPYIEPAHLDKEGKSRDCHLLYSCLPVHRPPLTSSGDHAATSRRGY